ncbi:MAG: hypothetical protein OIF48_04150 [Silicimonas sp.]|nr:hypothetical protein [Silicimonas sp.]
MSLTGSTLGWLIRQDFLDSNFQSNMFGGAYEIAVPDLSGFRRLPYLVLDIEAEAELADDGGFDIVSYQMKRLIFCVPFEWGSLHIISILGDSSHPTFNAFPAFQQNIDESSISLPSRPEEILEEFSPSFELVLIRHQDFNYFISKDVVSYSFSNGEFIVKLDEEKAAKAMNGTW